LKNRRCRTAGVALAALAGLGAAATGHAGVSEQVEHRYYDVAQRPGEPLLSALNTASPVREGSRTLHAHTAWNVRWQFRWNAAPGGTCRITSVATRLAVTMTLPRLRSTDALAAADFKRYYPALLRHEEGHRTLARGVAQEIDHRIETLPPMERCADLEREANRLGHDLVEDARQREIEYDRSTRHGCTQGACLTPGTP
jgi:predicted secreted Zn-dependent protease